jgi:hypothetical protein
MEIGQRVVFAFEGRPLAWRLAGLDELNSLCCVSERFGIVRLVFGGSGDIPGVSQVNLGAQVIRLVGKNPGARLVSIRKLLLVDQNRKISFALVALVGGDPLVEVVDVLVFVLRILLQVIARGLIRGAGFGTRLSTNRLYISILAGSSVSWADAIGPNAASETAKNAAVINFLLRTSLKLSSAPAIRRRA